jgi:hypothetical protein
MNNDLYQTLSHIIAINNLKNMDGNYFMICSNEIFFKNIYYFRNKTLKDIILESPTFDILLLYKIYDELPDSDTYVKWNDYKKNKSISKKLISYIISKNGVNKLCKLVDYNNNIFNFYNIKINKADIFLFSNLDTYIYKYNYINECINTLNNNKTELYYEIMENIKELNLIIKDNL